MEWDRDPRPDAVALMEKAERVCSEHGLRLTRLRRRVLELLLAAERPIKAYDLMEALHDAGRRIPPATIYRTLEFFLRQGLVHRVNALNAYVACSGETVGHCPLLLVCPQCRKTAEINDAALSRAMFGRLGKLGFSLAGGNIEIQGVCSCCARS